MCLCHYCYTPPTSSTRGKAAFLVQMQRGNSRGTSPGRFINILTSVKIYTSHADGIIITQWQHCHIITFNRLIFNIHRHPDRMHSRIEESSKASVTSPNKPFDEDYLVHCHGDNDKMAMIMVATRTMTRACGCLCQPGPPPCLKRHDAMVEDVKEGEVSELLLEHKEDGVGEVDELGDVEDPGEVESSNRLWIIRVINWLTSQAEKQDRKVNGANR